MNNTELIYLTPGQILQMKIGYSEAAVFTKIAGTWQTVEFKDKWNCYLINERGRTGGAYLPSELGIYENAGIFWLNKQDTQILLPVGFNLEVLQSAYGDSLPDIQQMAEDIDAWKDDRGRDTFKDFINVLYHYEEQDNADTPLTLF